MEPERNKAEKERKINRRLFVSDVFLLDSSSFLILNNLVSTVKDKNPIKLDRNLFLSY